MSKVIACVIARTVSKRLPLKVLRDIVPGWSLLDYLINSLKAVRHIDDIYICTSTEQVDDILEDVAIRNSVKIYRGSANKVIERMVSVGEIEQADILIRITGDNPFSSFECIDAQIDFLKKNSLDYVRLSHVPLGSSVEIISRKALEKCYNSMDPEVSEYLMLYLFEPKQFKCGVIKVFKDDYSPYSLTVDTPDDLRRARQLANNLFIDNKPVKLHQIISYIKTYEQELEAIKISQTGTIKMPYDKVISFEEFSDDMKRRVRDSLILDLYE